MGMEKPFKSSIDDTSSEKYNSQDGKPTNGTNSEQKNGVHKKSPHTTNFAGQPNEYHPANQPKGIISTDVTII